MIKLKIETLLIEIVRNKNVIDGSKNKGREMSKLDEICNYINENYREHITLGELCFLCGTNKTTLCSEFKKKYGCTPMEYRRRWQDSNI